MREGGREGGGSVGGCEGREGGSVVGGCERGRECGCEGRREGGSIEYKTLVRGNTMCICFMFPCRDQIVSAKKLGLQQVSGQPN